MVLQVNTESMANVNTQDVLYIMFEMKCETIEFTKNIKT